MAYTVCHISHQSVTIATTELPLVCLVPEQNDLLMTSLWHWHEILVVMVTDLWWHWYQSMAYIQCMPSYSMTLQIKIPSTERSNFLKQIIIPKSFNSMFYGFFPVYVQMCIYMILTIPLNAYQNEQKGDRMLLNHDWKLKMLQKSRSFSLIF